MKIIQLTDLHLVSGERELKGLQPETRLRMCLLDISRRHGDANALVVTGDITESGDIDSFLLFRAILGEFALPPVFMTVGNHDSRMSFADVFPQSIDAETGFAQCKIDLGDHAAILLDTLDEETEGHAGMLCAERLAWLDRQLAGESRQTLIFMHHAPFSVGLRRLDEITLGNEEALYSVLQQHRNKIAHLFFGHMHRNVSGMWRGFSYTVVPGTTHHAILDFDAARTRAHIGDPFYSVILVDKEKIVVHPNEIIEVDKLREVFPAGAKTEQAA